METIQHQFLDQEDEEETNTAIIHYGDQIVLFDNQRGGFVLSQISRFAVD
eukprot:gene9777-1977_t